jgi:undecaprenyl diphosphate synthase
MKTSIRHIAIIMDGNGRWATERRRPRVWGHVRGSNIVTSIVEKASDMKVNALTLYAFSTENWSRPDLEVRTLFKLLKKFLQKEQKSIIKNNIVFEVIGDISGLDEATQSIIEETKNLSQINTGLKLSFAFSYGGRQEIVNSINKHIKQSPGILIDESKLEENLYRPEIGDVDLLIRTGGDKRISNFLLWQVSYAELFFTDTKWPDFTPNQFETIVKEVQSRDRRFGSLDNAGSLEKTKILLEGKK